MDAEAHVLAHALQRLGNLGNVKLCLCYCETISWRDDDILGGEQALSDMINRRGCDLTLVLDRRITTRWSGRGSSASENDRNNVSSHGLAHDPCQNRSREANQSSHLSQQRVSEEEAFGTQSPSRVRVEHSDHHGHVGSANTGRQMPAEDRGDCCNETETSQLERVRTDRGDQLGAQEGTQTQRTNRYHGQVDLISARKLQWCRIHHTSELAKGNNRSREGHSSNQSGQVDRSQCT